MGRESNLIVKRIRVGESICGNGVVELWAKFCGSRPVGKGENHPGGSLGKVFNNTRKTALALENGQVLLWYLQHDAGNSGPEGISRTDIIEPSTVWSLVCQEVFFYSAVVVTEASVAD